MTIETIITIVVLVYLISVALCWIGNHYVYKDTPNEIGWVNVVYTFTPVINTIYPILIAVAALILAGIDYAKEKLGTTSLPKIIFNLK
jgi:hypothetical protein